MAIIYTYPNLPLSSLSADDLLVITNVDATNNNPTKSVTLADIATYVTGTGSGTGTTNKIVKFTDGANGLLGDSIMTESTGLIDLAGQFVSTSSPTLTQAAPVSGIKAILNGTTAAPNVALYGESKNTGSTQANSNYGLFAKGEFEGTGGFTGFVIGGNLEGRYDGTGTNGANATVYGSYNLARATTAANGTISYMVGASNLAKLEGANVTATNLQGTHSTVELSNGTAGDVIVQILDFDGTGGTVTGDLSYLQIQNDTMPTVAGTKRAINSKSVLPSLFTGQVEIPLVPTINAHATSKQYVDQQISSVVSGLVFISTWDASSTPGGNPDLTNASTQVVGHYYVVSVAGGATPNGAGTLPNSWNVGDWCIYVEQGATDRWEKLDQTFVSGAGAAGQVTFWNSQNEIAGDNDFFWDNTNKRLGIGVVSPTARLQVYESGTTAEKTWGVTNAGAILVAYQSTNGSPYTKTTDLVAGSDGTVPSEIRLITRTAGASSLSERLRIDSAGDILISPRGTAASSGSGILYFKNVDDNSATINGASIRTVDSNSNPSGADMRFQVASDAGTLFDAVAIDSNGFMGIGTTAPDYALDVVGSARLNSTSSTTLNIWAKNPTAFNDPQLNFVTWNEASGSSSGKIQLTNGTFNSNDMAFFTETANSVTEKMRIDSNGNFGFNVVAENSSGTWRNFQIGGANLVTRANDSNDLLLGTGFYFNTANQELYKNTESVSRMFFNNDVITFQNAASGTSGTTISWNETMRINSSGNVGIGTTSLTNGKLVIDSTANQIAIETGTAGDGRLNIGHFSNGTFIGTYGDDGGAADLIRFGTHSGDERMRINSSGNVGIGSVNPTTKLEINADNNGTTDLNLLNLKRTWSSGTSTDRSHGILFSDNNSSMATIYAVRTNSGANYDSDLSFATNTGTNGTSLSTKMIIKNTGNVGIGITSPSAKLQVQQIANTTATILANGDYGIIIEGNDSGTAGESVGLHLAAKTVGSNPVRGVSILGEVQSTSNDHDMLFATSAGGSAPQERMRIDSAGDVSLEKTTGSVFNFRRNDTTVVAGDGLGSIFFQGNDPSNPYKSGAAILAQGDGTWNMGTPNVYPSRLIFQTAEENTLKTAMVIKSDQKVGIGTTTPSYTLVVSDNGGSGVEFIPQTTNNRTTLLSYNRSGSVYNTLDFDASDIHFNISGTEKMRVDTAGNVLFGTTGVPNGTSIYGSGFLSTTNERMALVQATDTTSLATMQTYYNPNGAVGSIKTTGSATQFNTSSDYRLKKDLKDFDGLDKVSKIPVYDFKWKVDDSSSYGVMAHELQDVLPDAVSGKKDGEEMQGVDYSKVVPLLIKSIQELEAKVKILENK